MKANNIKKLLKGLVNNLCESIDDVEIIDIIKNKSYITGGCIPSMLLDEYINDFDIYFEDKESADKVKKYYIDIQDKRIEKFKVQLITENSINLSDKVQFIIKFYGRPEDVIEKFDWAHIKSFYKYPDKLNLADDIYKLIVEKDLIYTGSCYPLSSIMRLKKFIKKGWNVSNKTILEITLDVVQAFYNPKKKYSLSDIENNDEIENEDYEHEFDVNEILYHLNGVDPITIQAGLEKEIGKKLTIKEIIQMINGD